MEANPEVIQLDPRETFIIHTHASIVHTVNTQLPPEEQDKIWETYKTLVQTFRRAGDAGAVALQLLTMTTDLAEKPPYGETFMNMERLSWEQSLAFWQEGYKDRQAWVEEEN